MTSALVIGRGQWVWYEVERAVADYDFDYVIAVNRAGCDYAGSIEHWVSYHPELFPMWIELRQRKRFEPAGQLWTCHEGRAVDAAFERELGIKKVSCEGGSSGRIAVKVALHIGCDRIVLAGIPLTREGGHYDEAGEWAEAEMHRAPWVIELEQLKPYVRSYSGWTREVFGAPDRNWWNEQRGFAAAAVG